MKQLHMRRTMQAIIPAELPTGYAYERYTGQAAQNADWLRLCYPTLIPECDEKWFDSCILHYPDLVPERDLIFVIEISTQKRVATSAAVCHGEEGYIHMVAADPGVSGKGIGRAMLAFALQSLQGRGCKYSALTTDDFRLPAIKIYLDGGFCPVLVSDPESNMRQRWESVLRKLQYTKNVPFLFE